MNTPFRNWVRLMWEEHKSEVESYEGKNPDYDLSVYFGKYKWWLRREYSHQVGGSRTLKRDCLNDGVNSSVAAQSLSKLKDEMRVLLKADPDFTWRDALAVLIMNWRMETYPKNDPAAQIMSSEMAEYLCGIDIPWDKIDEIVEEYYGQ